ncbi:MAG: hypothetical protein JEZ00_21840 [Anaerolineaceae bacterium]|nr:hypothetical protein [Anaerolineaceae bacterium]
MTRFEKALQTFFLISAIEILLALIYLISIPAAASSENAGVMGFSGLRFAVLLLLAIALVIMAAFWVLLARNNSTGEKISSWLYQFSERKALLNLKSAVLLGTLISIYLVWKWLALPSTYEYSITLPRLLPIGFLALILFLQFYVILFFSKSSLRRMDFKRFSDWVQFSEISAKSIAWDLYYIAIFLVIASILGQWIKYFTPYYPYLDFLIVEFFLDSEQNIPTYFSAFLLLFSAALLFLNMRQVQKRSGKFVFQWGFLSFIFVYLAFDEVLQIHEMLTEPVRSTLNTSGALFFAWYIPVIPVLILLGLYYLRFVLALPDKQKIGYFVSGALYILGVIGIEIIGSVFGHNYGLGNFPYTMIATFEELVEMIGISLFIFYSWELVQLGNKNQVLDNQRS